MFVQFKIGCVAINTKYKYFEYITDLFKKTSVAHNRQLRSVGNDMLSIPRTKTSYYDRSFTVDGAKQWNELPINIKHSPSLLSFKNSIKAYLLLS